MDKKSTFAGRLKERLADTFGFQGDAERVKKEIQTLDNYVNLGVDLNFSFSQKSKIYHDLLSSIDNLQEIASNKLQGSSLMGNAEIYRKRVIFAKAELESKTGNYALKLENYTNILNDSIQKYIMDVYNNIFCDNDMLLYIKRINLILREYKNLFKNCNIDILTYDDLENLYSKVELLKAEIDSKTYSYTNQKEHLENSLQAQQYINNRKAIDVKKK